MVMADQTIELVRCYLLTQYAVLYPFLLSYGVAIL
jgi:hypothetical protein